MMMCRTGWLRQGKPDAFEPHLRPDDLDEVGAGAHLFDFILAEFFHCLTFAMLESPLSPAETS